MMLNVAIKPSMAWLLVFVPAVSYFMATRLQSSGFRWGRSNTLGDLVIPSLRLPARTTRKAEAITDCQLLSKVFFLASSDCQTTTAKDNKTLQLKYGLHLMYQGRGMQKIVASTWRHDEELGRGYLLLSQAHGNGRVWRWEVGGGPIAIGRSLHLESSGCRSNNYLPCIDTDEDANNEYSNSIMAGSGGLAIDFHQGDGESQFEGALVVAEWGEGRIIRMEESNGARTPLVVRVPDICNNNGATNKNSRRLYQPRSLLYTPYGDLLVADTDPKCHKAAIYRISQAVHVESLESLAESRKAHAWNNTQHGFPIDLLYQGDIQEIGGMAIDPSWLNMFVTVKDREGRVLLLQVPIVTEEDDDDDEEAGTDQDAVETGEDAPSLSRFGGTMDKRAHIVMDLTKAFGLVEPGPLAVSEKGTIFTSFSQGVAMLSTSSKTGPTSVHFIGSLPAPQGTTTTSLTIGEDKFLYTFSDDSMFRVRIKEGPVKLPTNLVVGKKADNKATF